MTTIPQATAGGAARKLSDVAKRTLHLVEPPAEDLPSLPTQRPQAAQEQQKHPNHDWIVAQQQMQSCDL